jgi:hypothetical protein
MVLDSIVIPLSNIFICNPIMQIAICKTELAGPRMDRPVLFAKSPRTPGARAVQAASGVLVPQVRE